MKNTLRLMVACMLLGGLAGAVYTFVQGPEKGEAPSVEATEEASRTGRCGGVRSRSGLDAGVEISPVTEDCGCGSCCQGK